MSEASRQRYLFLKNRLEELLARHGPPLESPLPAWLDHTDVDPTWGPVGSLAKRWLTEEYVRWLMAMDRDTRRQADIDVEAPEKPLRGSDW